MQRQDIDPSWQVCIDQDSSHIFLCIFMGAESTAEVVLYLGWFVDTAVISEVLLFGLHVIHGLLLGSVLQPGDGPTDPLQQLEADRKTVRKT